MSDKPGLSVLIPWFERDELRLTLAANAPFFRAQAADVLVLNCGGDSGRLRDLIAESETAGVRQLDISATHFNKSLALNIGISRSKSDIVLSLDADIVLLDDALAVRNASMDDQSFVTVEWVHESRSARSAGNAIAVAGSVAGCAGEHSHHGVHFSGRNYNSLSGEPSKCSRQHAGRSRNTSREEA